MHNNKKNPKYGIVGRGRVAKHLRCYFSALDIHHISLSPNDFNNQSTLLTKSTIILLAISDRTIESFLKKYHHLIRQKICIHFSGSVSTDLAFGFHPLMTFSSSLYTLEQYQAIVFIKAENTLQFCDVFPQLPNPCFSIKTTDKPYYHALCVLANNFSTLLWQKFFTEMTSQFQVPLGHLLPFFRQSMFNIETDYAQALTGPLVRGDEQTMTQHVNALKDAPFLTIYQSFVACYEKINRDAKRSRCECKN